MQISDANQGGKELGDVTFKINLVSGISTQIKSFETIEKLEAGELRSIPVEVTLRTNAGSGMHFCLFSNFRFIFMRFSLPFWNPGLVSCQFSETKQL